jgi:hypothetical protein
MPDQPLRKPLELGFAGFEASPAAAGRPRRKATWSLRPMHAAGEGAAVDGSRFVTEADYVQASGGRSRR